MAREPQPSATRTALLYAILCLPAVLLLITCIRGAYSEYQLVRVAALSTEASRLRTQATRRAGHLETHLESIPGPLNWDELRQNPWMQRYWEQVGRLEEHQLYAALVDRSGKIVMHSDPSLVGKELGRRWYDYAVTDAGSDVVHLSKSDLARQRPALDIRVPLTVGGRVIADYHQGLDSNWFESEVASMQRNVVRQWTWVIALAAAVDAAALAALVFLGRRHVELLKFVRGAGRERATQLGQIAAGLAHEIRNPLHSLRLNLYTLKRAFHGGRQPAPEDLDDSLQESNNAVDGLERLMRDLLRFTGSDGGQRTEVNLAAELQAIVNLMQPEMQQRQIDLHLGCSQEPVSVAIDPSRLRQLLQNLLTFAEHNAGPSGTIQVSLECGGDQAQVFIVDSGPKLTDSERERLFEPFQAKRETGSGLGLALVKAFAQEAGGDVTLNGQAAAGNAFRLVLPILSTSR